MTAIEWRMRLFGRGGVPEAALAQIRRYMMRERLVAIRDDFPIEDEEGELAFSVDGKALRNRDTLLVRDPHGNDLYRVPERALHLKTLMEIERGEGGTAATIRRTKVGTSHDRWTVTIPGGKTLQIRGSVSDHEYRIEAGKRQVAEVSKRWFRLQNTYGVAIPSGEDTALLLTIAAAVDLMAR
jgi:uncharacterized protein YxjI